MWKNASRLFFISTFLILCSCSLKHTHLPDYEGIGLQEVLSARNSVSSIETTFSIILERDDTEMRGDGALTLLKNGDLSLRIYSFGFLAFEMNSRNGIIKSQPPVDRNRSIILSSGLRDCLFWWDIQNFSVEENESVYILQNTTRSVRINKKTMLPVQQTIWLDDGRELVIRYEEPDYAGALWYPSKIRIELSRYAVRLNIREMSFLTGDQPEVNRDRLDYRAVNNVRFGQVSLKEGIVTNGVDKSRSSIRALEDAPHSLF